MQSKYLASDLKAQSAKSLAKMITRDGNEYIVNRGTIRAIKPINNTKKLSPSKLRRRLKRVAELDKLRPDTTNIL
jgi:hypothetical protein